MLAHCFLEEFQCLLLRTRLSHVAFQYFALVIHRSPQVVPFTVNLYEHLVKVPPPSAGFHPAHTTLFNLGGEYRTKSTPPISNGVVAHIDTPLMQKILHIAGRQRETDIQHHGQTDDLAAGIKVTEGAALYYSMTLQNRPPRLNPVSFDNTHRPYHRFSGPPGLTAPNL